MRYVFHISVFIFLYNVPRINAFLSIHHNPSKIPAQHVFLFQSSNQNYNQEQASFSSSYSSLVSIERETPRNIDDFQIWASECGVQAVGGFCILQDYVDGNEDYYASLSNEAFFGSNNANVVEGSTILHIPGEMILSANQMNQEFGQQYVDFSDLERNGFFYLEKQYLLFLKILMEYEQGVNSPYYPWLNSLPRKWNTAVSFDHFCMSTLPPYIKRLCMTEKKQFKAFEEALLDFDYISPEIKANQELLKFAYNVVFTRYIEIEGDVRIIPVADYFNYGYPENCQLRQNNGNLEVVLLQDIIEPGTPLTIQYNGFSPTNPSRLLARYGFLNDDNTPATYCKIMIKNPSLKLIDIGYDPEKLLFYTSDGSISQEVWDVVLFHFLEKELEKDQDPSSSETLQLFYEAHMSNDLQTKYAIHKQFQKETMTILLEHVNSILKEVDQLERMMLKFNNEDKHPRLPLLLKHHAVVISTFEKVRENLINMIM